MMYEDKRNQERLKEMDQLFEELRKKREALKIINNVYVMYKLELINTQKTLIVFNKLI